jgi:prepilin-type N-terminal cleavage/methylation domain-containing protein
MNSTKGFTLIEILVAVAVSMIMLSVIGIAINTMQKSSAGIERKVTAQQDVRAALELMAMEIRMASYNPTVATNAAIWRNTDCTFPATNPTYRGIQGATANAITVEMDISDGLGGDGNGLIMSTAAETNEIISYTYVSGQEYVTRETNCGGAQPFLGDLSTSGNPRTVRVRNAALNIPIFRYFDGQGNLMPVDASGNILNAGTQIPNIRMIEITLAVQTDEIDPSTKKRRDMIYSTREVLRNNIVVQ